jgi:hypothetical protein
MAARLVPSTGALNGAAFVLATRANRQFAPDVAWNGESLLVVWEDFRGGARDVFGARISPAGQVLDTGGIPISQALNDQSTPRVAALGTDFLVVWSDNRNVTGDIYMTRLNKDGVVQSPSGVAVATGGGQSVPDVAGGTNEWMVAWQGSPGVSVRPVSAAGTAGTAVPIIATNTAAQPALAWNGANYLLVWYDTRSGESIYGALLGTNGQPTVAGGSAISSTTEPEWRPAVASNGTEFLVAWETRPSSDRNVRAARVDASGAPKDPLGVDIAVGANVATVPAVGWDGVDYWVTWTDYGANQSDVYVARVGTNGTLKDPSGILAAGDPNADEFSSSIAGFGMQQSLLVYGRTAAAKPAATSTSANGRVRPVGATTARAPQKTVWVASIAIENLSLRENAPACSPDRSTPPPQPSPPNPLTEAKRPTRVPCDRGV